MSVARKIKNLHHFNFDLLEEDFEKLDCYSKTVKESREDISNNCNEVKTESYHTKSGAVYDLPYASFYEEKQVGLKYLEREQRHPMLFFNHFHVSTENFYFSKWFLGSSNTGASIIKQKSVLKGGVGAFVFELSPNSIYDPFNNRKYPLIKTNFLIHPDMLLNYKYSDAPCYRSYRGSLSESVFERIVDNYNRISNCRKCLEHNAQL